MPVSRSASPTPARARCTSSPRWTASRACIAVLALFEGVATGAADGYARMADKPAATLLHLGCGLGGGLANLHNARKGKVPVVNIVGDHATYHAVRRAAAVRHRDRGAQRLAWLRAHRAKHCGPVPEDAADAIAATRGRCPGPGGHAAGPAGPTCRGARGGQPCPPRRCPRPPPPATKAVQAARTGVIRSGAKDHRAAGRPRAGARAAAAAPRALRPTSGVQLLAEVPHRMERGAGLPAVERVALPGRAGRATGGRAAPGAGRCEVARARSSPSGPRQDQRPLVPAGCTVHTCAARRRTRRRAWNKLAAALAPAPGAATPWPGAAPCLAARARPLTAPK